MKAQLETTSSTVCSPQSAREVLEDSCSLPGTLNTKIVGVRFYNGIATPGEYVTPRREPHNQYDRNAIRVDNVMNAQIGHIPRQTAAKFAKYMVHDFSRRSYSKPTDHPLCLRTRETSLLKAF